MTLNLPLLTKTCARLARAAARRFDLPEQDVAEVAQLTLIEAWKQQDKLRDAGSLDSWIYVVARRACLRIKTAQLRLDALDDVDAGELARGFEQLGTLAESSPMLDEVQAALDAAGGDIRSRVAVLHYREGHAAKDIASSLRIPLNTVLSHLRRFRLELQKTMARDHACNIAALAAHS